ncbi:MAG: diaminopimelate epimerase [Ignavibacteria bacterium]|nr:diaminopimelate epimerase [Ignavibacteria bacterium]
MSLNNHDIDFLKVTGAGNDFILIDNMSSSFMLDWTLLAPQLCDRRFGIGADGLLVIEKSSRAEFKMLYYNADGTYGGMCGNGGRCAAAYVMSKDHRVDVRFEALNHLYGAQQIGKDIQLKMKQPIFHESEITIQICGKSIPLRLIDTGSPHAVIFVCDLPAILQSKVAEEGIEALGRTIRNHEKFAPLGTNVDFIEIIRENEISMRTYERGVEAETLACGTGAVASAIASALVKGFTSPVNVKTRSNQVLIVKFQRDSTGFSDVSLIGPVKFVFRGKFTVQHDHAGSPTVRLAFTF